MAVLPKLVVVLGMHRCGTSAITRSLQTMGIDLGSNLMAPMDAVNEKGFWEDLDINQLNVEMLKALEIDWHSIKPVSADSVLELKRQGFLSRASQTLRNKTTGFRSFGFKDPRVTQLLPFWVEAFRCSELEVAYVMAVRNPLSVAESLRLRDQFDFEKSILLWLGHTVTMMVCTLGARRVLVDYDRLIDLPEREITRIAKSIGASVNPAELVQFTSEFLDKRLRHSTNTPNDLMGNVLTEALVFKLYETLHAAATDVVDTESDQVVDEVNRSKDILERWTHGASLLDKLYAFKREAILELKLRGIETEEAKTHLDALKESVAHLHAEKESITLQLKSANEWISGMKAELQLREAAIVDLKRVIDQREIEVSELLLLSKGRETELLDLKRQLERQIEINRAVSAKTKEMEADAFRLRRSNREFEEAIDRRDRNLYELREIFRVATARMRDFENELAGQIRNYANLHDKQSVRSVVPTEIDKVLDENGANFVQAAFQLVLRRIASDAESAEYLERLRSGTSKTQLLVRLSRTNEGRLRRLRVPGLRKRAALHKLSRIPFLSVFAGNNLSIEREDAPSRKLRAELQRHLEIDAETRSFLDRLLQEAQALREAIILRERQGASERLKN